MKVNICGMPHKVVECEDRFDNANFGVIDYKKCEISINKDMAEAIKKETLCHEIVHGILFHLGYTDYANDEQFVQVLANAIYQGFDIKAMNEYSIDEINKMADKVGIVCEGDVLHEVR